MRLKNERLFWFLLLVGSCITLVVGMNQNIIGDASLYASITKRMMQTGNMQDLFLLDKPYLQKPHLLFWLTSLSFQFFGFTSFAFKLPSVLIGLSGVFAIYKIGEVVHSSALGKLAAFFWAFSLAFLLHMNDVHMDTMMCGFILWVAYCWVKYLLFTDVRFFFAGCIPLALAMMTKGPLGAFIPVTGFLLAVVIKRKWTFVFRWQHVAGALFTLLLLLPVVYFIFQQHGWDGVNFYFLGNNTSRIAKEGSFFDKDFSFYIHTMLWFFLPWSLVSFFALYSFFRKWIKDNQSIAYVFFFGSFIVFFCIASVSDQQAPHYMYSLLPFVALLAAERILHAIEDNEKIRLWAILLQIPLWASLLVIGVLVIGFRPTNALIIITILLLGVAFYSASFEKRLLPRLLLRNAVAITGVFAFLNIQVFQHYFKNLDAPAQAVKEFNKRASGADQLYLITYDHAAARADFYSQSPTIYHHYKEDIQLPDNAVWILANEEGKNKVDSRTDTEIVGTYDYLRLTDPLKSLLSKYQKQHEFPHYYLLKKTEE